MVDGNNIWTNSSVLTEDFYRFNITIPSGFQLDDSSLTYEIDITDTSGNTLKLNPLGDANSNEFSFEPTPKPPGETEEPEEPPEPEDITEPATVIETIITTDEDGNEVTITNTTIIMPANSEETNNALWIIAGFLGLLGLLTLYYQRNNIKDMIQQQRRRKK